MASIFRRFFIFTFIFSLIYGFQSHPEIAKTKNFKKVLLISIDTLRPDYLGCYGSRTNASRNIDSFASKSLLFKNVTAQAPSTAISHKSILYSLYPSIHKTSNRSVPLEQLTSPIQTLQQNGFNTAAFVGGGELSRKFGFAKGFNTYWESGNYSDSDSSESLDVLQNKVFEWLDTNYNNQFFLFVHTYEIHCPYFPPKKYRDKFAGWYHGDIEPKRKCGDNYYNLRALTFDDQQFLRDLYTAEISFVDDFIGRLLEKLKQLKIYDQTLICFFSDHGESLGERKYIGHNQLYEIQLRVPFILHIPNFSGLTIDTHIEAIDLMPTVFRLVGISPPYRFQGKDLTPLFNGLSNYQSERILFAEQSKRIRVRKGERIAIFALDEDRSSEVYDLRDDPDEIQNGTIKFPEFLDTCKLDYFKMLKAGESTASKFLIGDNTTPRLDELEKEQLMSLGYSQ